MGWGKLSFKGSVAFAAAVGLGILMVVAPASSAYALSTFAMQLGGPGTDDMFRGIERTSDGYVVVGTTDSFGAGKNDAWIVSLDENGNVESQTTYGSRAGDVARSVKVTEDGGFVIGGLTNSFTSGRTDFWIAKFGEDQELEWSRNFGGSNNDMAHAVEATSDGGYLLGGFTTSFGAVGKDYLLVKLDSSGLFQWAKKIGGSKDDVIRIVKETSNGDFLAAGFTHSAGTAGEILVVKLKANGDMLWQKTYGGAGFEEPSTILEVPDGFIILEQTRSFSGSTDGWMFKIDESGAIKWQKRFGGGGFDELSAARLTDDGGFIVAGETRSFGAVNEDYWVAKFESDGDALWQKRYGGSGIEEAEALALTPEGGVIVVGTTMSFGAVGEDVWLIRLDKDGNMANCGAGVTANQVTTAQSSNTGANPVPTNLGVTSPSPSMKSWNPTPKPSAANIAMQCDITKINRPPVALDDIYSTEEDTTLTVTIPGVLANDTDDDGDSLFAELVQSPANGDLTLGPDGSFTYVPDSEFQGVDTFQYKANDGTAQSNTATVSINVGEVDDPPVAEDGSISTVEDTAVSFKLNATDPDSSTLTYIVETPTFGELSGTAPDLIYTPNANYSGPDSFTFVANDGTSDSNTATISITVIAVNDDADAVDDEAATDLDTAVVIFVLDNDFDVDNDEFGIDAFDQTTEFGQVTDNGDGSLTYTPNPGFEGTDTFSYTITDGNGGSDTALVTVTVTGVPDG